MFQVMIAAPASGSGKTVLSCVLLRVLQRRGLNPCAFKCGPDYIDPMFHQAVLGVESRNLDLFLASPHRVRELYATACENHGSALCEGVMGFYDGLGGGTDKASTWAIADCLDLPTILVIRPRGASLTVAAQVLSIMRFRQPSHLVGAIFNHCTPSLAKILASVIETECGLPVLGSFPPCEEARLANRHLGLYTVSEIEHLDSSLETLAGVFERSIDVDRLLSLCDRTQKMGSPTEMDAQARAKSYEPAKVSVAIADDDAFCFTYGESLQALRSDGATLVPFSPLMDEALPNSIGGLYLPGGYPELHAHNLSRNRSMVRSIREAVDDGLPTVAECGGYLYLLQSLEDETGVSWPQARVLPGEGRRTDRLQRFGYATLSAQSDSLLFEAGQCVPVHEFHYWKSTEPGEAFSFKKPVNGRNWCAGFSSPSLYAAFSHLYFAGIPQVTRRFVHHAAAFAKVSCP